MRVLIAFLLVLFVAGHALAAEPPRGADRVLEQCRPPGAVTMTVAALIVARDDDCACGTKTKCGQMDSCAEAMCFLEKCGVTRLDGDGDGTPCESICG